MLIGEVEVYKDEIAAPKADRRRAARGARTRPEDALIDDRVCDVELPGFLGRFRSYGITRLWRIARKDDDDEMVFGQVELARMLLTTANGIDIRDLSERKGISSAIEGESTLFLAIVLCRQECDCAFGRR